MKTNIYIFSLALLLLVSCNPKQATIPRLEKKGTTTQLMINEKPFIILGGELFNSSGTSLEYMNPIWKRMKDLNLNTLFIGVSWRQFEPVEGKFDLTLVESLIAKARENDLKICFLWFAAWKNGNSGYAPEWVLSDLQRFPRMQDAKGKNLEVLSNLSDELCTADSKAFATLIRLIKKIDTNGQTVLMVQIENEIGLMGAFRDYSKLANEKYNSQVPEKLIDYMAKYTTSLTPYLKKAWSNSNYKKNGTWLEVFSSDTSSEQIFMAWSYACYVERVAAAGKKEHPILMNINAWLADDNATPGTYPSGGPTAFNLDIYRAAGTTIDIYSPDIYVPKFKEACKLHKHNGNPLLIPEACGIWLKDTLSGPAKAYYTIAEEHAIGFAPFAIDAGLYHVKHPISKAYKNLNQLMPFLTEWQGTNKLRGFMQQTEMSDSIEFDTFKFYITYKTKPGSNDKIGYGLIIQLSDNEFVLSGNSFSVNKIVSKMSGQPLVSITSVQEVEYLNGKWKLIRDLGGDEVVGQGTEGPFFPPATYSMSIDYNYIAIQKIRIIAHN